MGRVVSKPDALTEMIKAYENKDEKRAKKIAELLSNTIQKEGEDSDYVEYIGLDRQKKQLFPKNVRTSDDKCITGGSDKIIIKLDDGDYELSINENHEPSVFFVNNNGGSKEAYDNPDV